MKKIAILSACLVLMFALAYTASADIGVTSAFNKDNPTFGGSSQAASNPNADDEDDQEIYVSGSVSVINNGTVAVTINDIVVTPKATETGQTLHCIHRCRLLNARRYS